MSPHWPFIVLISLRLSSSPNHMVHWCWSDWLLHNKPSQNRAAPNHSHFFSVTSLQLGLGKMEMVCLLPLDIIVPLELWSPFLRGQQSIFWGYKLARAEVGGHIHPVSLHIWSAVLSSCLWSRKQCSLHSPHRYHAMHPSFEFKQTFCWFMFVCFWDKIALYGPGRPQSFNSPASAFFVLELQVCTTMAGLNLALLNSTVTLESIWYLFKSCEACRFVTVVIIN